MLKNLLLFGAALIALSAPTAHAQASRGVRAVAVLDAIYADSAGHAIRHGARLAPTSLDSLIAVLRPQRGATLWFSWAGGPAHRRTSAQAALLARLRQSGIRVELRTDSTFRARVVHE
jgi:hypothetical protein